MKESDKQLFRKSLSGNKGGIELLNMMKAFEQCNQLTTPRGIVKRLVTMQGGKDLRNYNKLKSLLFEFEISSKRLNHFRKTDIYTYNLFDLKKRFLAAQMMTEKDAYLTSIQSMTEIFKKAGQYDYLELQKDCAINLTSYYNLTGNKKASIFWTNETIRILNDLIKYNSVHQIFEKELLQLDCCNYHKSHQFQSGIIDKVSSVRTINSMLKIIEWRGIRKHYKSSDSFKESLNLHRELIENPEVYPGHFQLIMKQFVYEDLYRLGRITILKRQINKIAFLDQYPIYRRIPLINFYLFFFYKTKDFTNLRALIGGIDSESAYSQFQPFMIQFIKIKTLYLLSMKKEKEALRILNRKERSQIKCEFTDFEYRLIEIICFYRLSEWSLLEDKIDSLRQFTFRHDELKNSAFCLLIFNCIRSLILHNKIDGHLLNIYHEDSVYDLREEISLLVKDLTRIHVYPSNASLLSIAAEDQTSSGKRRYGEY